MKTCKKCNLSHDDDKKLCKNCGNPLEENSSLIPNGKVNNTTLILMIIIAWNVIYDLIWLFAKLVQQFHEQNIFTIGPFILMGVTLAILGVSIYYIREKKVRLFLSICMTILIIRYVIEIIF